MYMFIDRPVTDLSDGGRLLVWAMRSWFATVRRRVCPGSVLAPAFAQHKMLIGLQPFLQIMVLLDRQGLQNFEFCEVSCDKVSEHEALMLSMLQNAQTARTGVVQKTLALMIDEDGIGALLCYFQRLGSAMAKTCLNIEIKQKDSGAGLHPRTR